MFGSALKSEIKDDLIIGECTRRPGHRRLPGLHRRSGDPIFAPTAGKRESGAAKYTFGGTVRGHFGPFEIGITGKRTGPRFIFDTNEPVHAFVGNPAVDTIVFPATDAGLLAGQSRCPSQPGGLRPGEVLPPVQRLQSVRPILCRRVRRRPQPDDHPQHQRRDHRLRRPALRPDRRSAHDQRDPGRRLLIELDRKKGRRDPGRGGLFF